MFCNCLVGLIFITLLISSRIGDTFLEWFYDKIDPQRGGGATSSLSNNLTAKSLDNSPQQDMPAHAMHRLHMISGQTDQKPVFTSNLSVNEFLLAKESGFEPLGLVMGSSIYHVGRITHKLFQSHEIKRISQARYQARELAMARMQKEAAMLNADGIIGVRLHVKGHDWGSHLSEFVAFGTAIRSTRENSYPIIDDLSKPFTSDLSGQDFWTLLQAGYFPIDLVMGNCVYYVNRKIVFESQYIEMSNYTQALYNARSLAMERMQAEAINVNAEGIVGARIEEEPYPNHKRVIEIFSIGTAIVSISEDHNILRPTIMMNLNK